MTPTISLFLVTFLVLALTYLRRKIRYQKENFSVAQLKMSILLHLIFSVGSGITVWLLNKIFWQDWPDHLAVLFLLILVGLGMGTLTAGLLYGKFWEYKNTPQAESHREATYSFGREIENNMPRGVIHIKKFGPARGVLPSGTKVVWDDTTGRWRDPGEPTRKIS